MSVVLCELARSVSIIFLGSIVVHSMLSPTKNSSIFHFHVGWIHFYYYRGYRRKVQNEINLADIVSELQLRKGGICVYS